ncbi:AfsR/SARP family transcriptional regulator [Streptosporangium sp. KLBMP 9127]|nr:AfsR/SARP family transcriptional regulator [Streptosporangium sp. KLBMP 9127]
MEFLLLGPLAVCDRGTELTPTPPKVREVLALLLLRNNQLVLMSELIDELWPDHPPTSAQSTLQTYIYKIRKIFTEGADGTLLTRPYGYMLTVPPDHVDLHRFERLMSAGSGALTAGDHEAAQRLLSQALTLWRGPALADVTAGGLLSTYITSLEESRLQALALRIEADLHLGGHQVAIRELKELVSANPLHEGFHTQLMLAMHRSGRRAEALDAYQNLRRLLVEDLGVEPSAKAQRLHQALLCSDPSLDHASAVTPTPIRVGPAAVTEFAVPAQLPPNVADFVSRGNDVDLIVNHLTRPASTEDDTTLRIISISGMPGIGKTALAVRAAHRLRPSFPDGQLFADLRGTAGDPADPADVLTGFLRAAGLPDDRIPPNLDGRASAFRTWAANRRLLLLLDDAASARQFQPLLPGSAPSAAIVTGRTGLRPLPGATSVNLGLLTTGEGVELLENIAGRTLLAGERPAADTLVELCGHLPLAIRAAGVRFTASGWPLDKFTRHLAGARRRLDELRFDGLDVRARLRSSYLRLARQERLFVRLLSLIPPAAFTARGVARMLELDPAAVDGHLARLVENHFLRVEAADELVYSFHELVRLFAREQVLRDLTDPATGSHPLPRAAQGAAFPHGRCTVINIA